MLLHSVGCSAMEFEDVMRPLAARYRVFAWDMLGHGDSDPMPWRMSIEEYASSLSELIEVLALGRCHIAGASIGGLIALEMATSHMSRVASVALLETGLLSEERWIGMWPTVELTFGIPTQSLDDIRPRFRSADDALLTRWNIDRNKAGGASMVAAMWAIRNYRFGGALGDLRVPALFLYGSNSPVKASLETLETIRPAADVRILPDCGHFPMVDDPPAFSRTLLDFLDSVSMG